jgi:hypothetical protein
MDTFRADVAALMEREPTSYDTEKKQIRRITTTW